MLRDMSKHWSKTRRLLIMVFSQRLLLLLSVAWALVGWCHLGAVRQLVQAFMGLYAAPGLGSLGFRSPTLAEAEHADGELCRQLHAWIPC
jgi:hypothetical protein